MKLQNRQTSGTAGSALLLTVVIMGVVGFLLLAYLKLVQAQNHSTMRSQAWNNAIPVVEGGIEEALAHLNERAGTNLACDGWVQLNTSYFLYRRLGDSFALACITNYFMGVNTTTPVIEVRGFVPLPLLAAGNRNCLMADAVGGAMQSRSYLVRGVRVVTRGTGLFSKGLVAKGQITLSGGVQTDSFDSADPARSTNGQYDPAKVFDNGDVASNGQLVREINATGNVKVRGHVSTGPGGTVGLTGNSAIGSKAWIDAGNTGIQPGWFSDDMNVEFPAVAAPFSGGAFTPGSGTVSGTNYNYVLGSGNYQLSSVGMSGQQKMIITGQAVLYVTGNVSLSGLSYVYVAPGGSLKLYVGGSSASLSGQGVLNATGSATNFQYFGLPGNTSLSLSGNSAFTGIIYAPSASFAMSGGGNDIVDFIGASITGSVSMSGTYNFHYDESLSRIGPHRSYVITSWNEMSPSEVGATVVTMNVPY